MSNEPHPKTAAVGAPQKIVTVGEFLERTADALTQSSDPERRDAAAAWLKIIRRRLAREKAKLALVEQQVA